MWWPISGTTAIMAVPIITKTAICACVSPIAIAGRPSTIITIIPTLTVLTVIIPVGTVPGTATGPGIISITLIADGTLAVVMAMAMEAES